MSLKPLLVKREANINLEACDGLRADDLGRSLGSKVGRTNLVLQSNTNENCFIMFLCYVSNLYSLLVKRGANVNVEACDGLRADDVGRSLGLDSADYIQRARQAQASHLSACAAKVSLP